MRYQKLIISLLFASFSAAAAWAAPGDTRVDTTQVSVEENIDLRAVVTLRVEGPISNDVIVHVQTEDGTAKAGTHYTAVDQNLTFKPGGPETQNVLIPIFYVDRYEANPQFKLRIIDIQGNGQAIGSQEATITILDFDSVLQLTQSNYSATEGNQPAQVFVSRIGGIKGVASAKISTTEGTALSGKDFIHKFTSVVFDPGVRGPLPVDISLVNDTLYEPNETFTVTLNEPGGAAELGTRTQATVTIQDDDANSPGEAYLGQTTFVVYENEPSVRVEIYRRGGNVGQVSVEYETLPDLAEADVDFQSRYGSVVFRDGEIGPKVVTIPIIDDAAIENEPENFFFDLLRGTGGVLIGTESEAEITILDDDEFTTGTLQLVSNQFSVDETGGSISINVTRQGGNIGTLSADYRLVSGSANSGADYSDLSGRLIFPPTGPTSQVITIPILNDTETEGDETFTFELENAFKPNMVGSPRRATITIRDDEQPIPGVVTLETTGIELQENEPSVRILVLRTGGSDGQISVRLQTVNGSATAPQDYQGVDQILTFAAGDTNPKAIDIPIVNDNTVELDEYFEAVLSQPTGTTLGAISRTTILIRNDDISIPGQISFAIDNTTVREDEGFARLIVFRQNGSDGIVSIDYRTLNGSAQSGLDFTAKSGTLQFGNGDTTPQAIDISILDDTLLESAESFQIELFNPVGATLGGNARGTITINDNEVPSPGVVRFPSNTGSVDEGIGSLQIPVLRENGTNGPLQVSYRTVNLNSATPDSDFTPISGTILFADGDSTIKTITLPILEDTLDEPDEILGVELYSNDPSILGTPVGLTLTIQDNDEPVVPLPGTFTIVNTQTSVDESNGTARIFVFRNGGTDGDASIEYRTINQTAISGQDFVEKTGTLQFADGDTNPQAIDINILNDSEYEGVETFQLEIRNPVGAALATSNIATISILDDEAPSPGVLGFSVDQISTRESDGTVQVTVTREAGSFGPASVEFKTTENTARAGQDFTAKTGTLNFSDGDTTPQTITIDILDDNDLESTESFSIELLNAAGAVLGSQNQITVSITDNEIPQVGIVRFPSDTARVPEGYGIVQIPVFRENGSDGVLTVGYRTQPIGGITPNSDYTPIQGTIQFLDGETGLKTISLQIIDDNENESDESLLIELTASNGSVLGDPHQFTLTIEDNDEPGSPQPGILDFGQDQVGVDESVGTGQVTVHRTGGSDGRITVDYEFQSITANGNEDFTGQNGTLVFEDGDVTAKTISYTIVNDTIGESTEFFNIVLSNPTGGASIGTLNKTSIIIVDDDESNPPPKAKAPEIRFENPYVAATEAAGVISIRLTQVNENSGDPIIVQYAVFDDSAVRGIDYELNGTGMVTMGEDNEAVINIEILEDKVLEDPETFRIQIISVSGNAIIGDPQSVLVTIVDNENPERLFIEKTKNIFNPHHEKYKLKFGLGFGRVHLEEGLFEIGNDPQSYFIEAEIYNLAGQLIQRILSRDLGPGLYESDWDGRNEFGTIVASDAYILIIKVDGKTQAKLKIIVRK